MTEIWKPLAGKYKGFSNYCISNYGRLVSCKIKKNKWKLSAKNKKKNGYIEVTLWKNNKQYFVYLHILVLEAFEKRPSKNHQVNHKDHIKENNNLENLEWTTCSENQQKAMLFGARKIGILDPKIIALIRLEYKENCKITKTALAKKYNTSRNIIFRIIRKQGIYSKL